MAEKTEGQQYMEQAGKTTDSTELRKILNRCAIDLDRAIQHIHAIEEEDARIDRAAERRAKAIAAAESAAAEARGKALRATAKLVPTAMLQARKGKPALLRLILRATR